MSKPDMLRILIADDHEGFRRELSYALQRESDITVVADVSNGADAIQRVRTLRPHGLDLVLMDIEMPIMNGLDATRELVAADPSLAVIILTVSTLDRDLFAGVGFGAVGFLNKSMSPSALIHTLRDFRRNGSLPMSRVMAGKVLAHLQHNETRSAPSEPPAYTQLTSREHEILRCIAGGARDREIATALAVAETTVKTHVRHILRKLGARNRAEAVARQRARESG